MRKDETLLFRRDEIRISQCRILGHGVGRHANGFQGTRLTQHPVMIGGIWIGENQFHRLVGLGLDGFDRETHLLGNTGHPQ